MKDYKKELTIEQKAEAYDLALAVLHKYDGANIMFSQDLKEEMFPELRESEDDRMKRSFIRLVEAYYDVKFPTPEGFTRNDMLAWLEKKCKQKPAEQSSFTFDDILALQCAMASAKESDEKLYEALRSLHDRVHDIYHGEHKENVEPAGKPEPKFRVRDWIMYYGKPYQITDLKDDAFTIIGCEGGYFSSKVESTHEPVFHLWTIQDAKDGDVLVDVYGNIGIFKERYGINWHTYCYLGNEGRFISEGGSHGSICYPATKEQRDTLFAAMKEAGYEWDAEKKELKKIEQTTAWSKEDEDYYNTIITKLEITKDDALLSLSEMNFLKSLKDRVQPQWEYIRTDAFIEKAEAYLRENQKGFILTDKDITDFINYMKGE